MSCPESVAAAITDLLRTLPPADASTGERADWFDRKAAVLQAIADRAEPESATAADLAAVARADAARRRSGGAR